ncbi:hypothetical protein [Rhodoplanes sp. Z2-YC6860]|uniref:hypothetical protein n=1 Tax=Rhodoplanes sp. Z2-YC6860 TaxID=674703 RepID=UPI00078EE100|nr:hypothetical protein [Rhodoplanes sp. Z2-YC6860]AMN44990.1 hypothetical protein RHPLAN_65840 [Rhodoplanes sp. Z2-YC6860]
MSEDHRKLSGKITHVFAHRFVIETPKGAVLADVTPHGMEAVTLRVGADVQLEGEMKPSELKVFRFTSGGKSVAIEHKKKHHDDHHGPADPEVARRAARQAGFEPVGEPRRKPKHFEVLGRRQGIYSELHIELDGHIRKTKPVHDDPKWADALRSS